MGKLNRRRYKKKAKKVLGGNLWKFYPLLEEPLPYLSLCNKLALTPIGINIIDEIHFLNYGK